MIYQKLAYTLNKCHQRGISNQETSEAILYKNINEDKYKQMLISNLFIFINLEDQIANTLFQFSHTQLHDFYHSKIDWLCNDLKAVGMLSHLAFPSVFSPPQFRNISEVLGGLFVLEGSMVGNRMIYNWLCQSPYLNHIEEFNFYKNYDKDVGRRWRYFHKLLEKYCEDESAAILATENTFNFFHQAMKCKNLVAEPI